MNTLGSSVRWDGIKKTEYVQLLVDHFDWWYPDNGFRWQEKGNVADNRKTEEIVNLAVQNNKAIRGNNLTSATNVIVKREVTKHEVWHYLEKTLEQFPAIDYWDAVHEVTGDNGLPRRSVWRKSLGENWEELIFRWANTIAPGVKLFYCDYFRDKRKWTAVYDKVAYWLSKDVPIHGISVQLHSNLKPSLLGRNASLNIKEAEYWMKRFKALGLLLHVPEIVVWQPSATLSLDTLRGKSNLWKEIIRKGGGDLLLASHNVPELQKKVYHQILQTCRFANADMMGFWSAFDKYPWNWVGNRAKAGFWDEDFSPKESCSLIQNNY